MCGKHFGESVEDDVQVVARSYRSWEIWVLDNRFTGSKTMHVSFAKRENKLLGKKNLKIIALEIEKSQEHRCLKQITRTCAEKTF